MKNKIVIILALTGIFFSCSKSSNKPQTSNTNSVTINGADYATVVIGTQTWTAVNYNGTGGVNYNNGANNAVYGKLYTLAEAKAISLPAGWRLPTETDFNNLIIAAGATDPGSGAYPLSGNDVPKLMSKSGWTITNGTDSLGFNAQPAGFYNQVTLSNQQFNSQGSAALFLSATTYFTNSVFNFSFEVSAGNAGLTDLVLLETDAASIRFVKDN
jgi:uncharacterized protein (TIGR02145 family)